MQCIETLMRADWKQQKIGTRLRLCLGGLGMHSVVAP
jgi:hypothetical protein